MKLVRASIALIALLELTTGRAVPHAEAGGLSGVATEWTQILNNIQLQEANTEWLQQLEDDFQSLNNQLTQIQTAEAHLAQAETQTVSMVNTIPNQIFGPALADMQKLASIVQTGQGLAYSMANLDQQFATRYKGYGNAVTSTYPQLYKGWAQTSLDTTHGTLSAVGIQGQQLTNDNNIVTQLQQQAQSTTGMMQALQTANQIAAQEAVELQKLRVLMMADIASKQAYQAQQISEQMATIDMGGTFFTAPNTPSTNSDSRTFAPVPSGYGSGSTK